MELCDKMTHLRCPPKRAPRWKAEDWLQQKTLAQVLEIAEFPSTLLAYAADLTEDQRDEVHTLAKQVRHGWQGDH